MNSTQIVARLGGPTQVGRMLGVSGQAVTYWCTREPKEIPYHQRVKLIHHPDCDFSIVDIFPEIFL